MRLVADKVDMLDHLTKLAITDNTCDVEKRSLISLLHCLEALNISHDIINPEYFVFHRQL